MYYLYVYITSRHILQVVPVCLQTITKLQSIENYTRNESDLQYIQLLEDVFMPLRVDAVISPSSGNF